MHLLKPADVVDQPFEDEAADVDRVAGRRVVHRTTFGQVAVVEHGGQVVGYALQQIFADDDHGRARRAGVLLRAGVDQTVFRHVDRAADEIGRHVADERDVARGGLFIELDAEDRLVRSEMDISGAYVQFDLFGPGQAIEIGAGGRRGFANRAAFLRLFERALAPTAGENVIGALAPGLQIHRNHSELQARAALQ